MNSLEKTVLVVALLTLGLATPLRAQPVNEAQDYNVTVTTLERPTQVSLNGDWFFRTDPKNVGEAEGWFRPGGVRDRVVPVPLPWQLAVPELREYLGVAWYARKFRVPPSAHGRRVAVEFLGVDNSAKIWVNGKPAGQHEGALTPFALDITPLVKIGDDNTVTVKVTDLEYGTRVWTNEQIIATSGLWRDVYLEITGSDYVSDIFAVPSIDTCTADVRVSIAGREPLPTGSSVSVTVRSPDDQTFSVEKPVSGTGESVLPISLGHCVLWELDHPALYRVHVELKVARKGVDSASTEFGMRKISTHGKDILLNNHPIYVVGGWLDTSPYGGPDEVNWALPPPYKQLSDEDIKRDIATIKALNVNYIRRILRSINPRFLYWADRMGLLVQQGGPWMAASGIDSVEAFEKYKQGWRDIITRDHNHPSVVTWELFTENGGLGVGEYSSWAKTSDMVAAMYDFAKNLDPTRLVLDDSGGRANCTINYPGNHPKSDIDDVLFFPDASAAWIQGVADQREYTPRVKSYGKPVIDSLLDNLTSRVVDADKARRIWGNNAPWWFTAPASVSSDSTNLTGFEDRFYKWGFDKIFGNFSQFTHATDRYEFEGMKFEAEERRKNPDITGYLGFLFDTPPHFIGAVDVFRDRKPFFDELSRISQQDLVMLDAPKRNVWSGETVRAQIFVSHYSASDLSNATAEWWVEGEPTLKGEVQSISVDVADVRPVGVVSFNVPAVPVARSMRLKVRLLKDASAVSENYLDLLVFPTSDLRPSQAQITAYGLSRTTPLLQVLGYDTATALEPHRVVVANRMDEKLSQFVQGGGTAVLFVTQELDWVAFLAPPKIHPLEDFLAKHGLLLGGRDFHFGGITGAHFINKSFGMFDRIPFQNPIAWPFYRAIPQSVLIGLTSDQQPDIIAGAYGSFFRNSPADSQGNRHKTEVTGTILQFRYGKGKLVLTTFDLLQSLAEDPVATVMFNDLVRYAAGDFHPRTELDTLPSVAETGAGQRGAALGK
jgi:hypothetical protein